MSVGGQRERDREPEGRTTGGGRDDDNFTTRSLAVETKETKIVRASNPPATVARIVWLWAPYFWAVWLQWLNGPASN